MLVDFASAAVAALHPWEIDVGHFAERNGLFVLIALGESIVAVGLGAANSERSTRLVVTLFIAIAIAIAFAGAGAIWWAYFDRAPAAAEGHLKQVQDHARSKFARDAYSVLHFPVALEIVLFAFGVEEVVAHPGSRLDAEFRFAITGGVSLVFLAVVAGTYLDIRRIPIERLVGAVNMIGLAAAAGEMRGDVLAAVVVAGLIGILTWERRHRWPQPRIDAGLSKDKESSPG